MEALEIKRTENNGKFYVLRQWCEQYKFWQLVRAWQTFNNTFYRETIYKD